MKKQFIEPTVEKGKSLDKVTHSMGGYGEPSHCHNDDDDDVDWKALLIDLDKCGYILKTKSGAKIVMKEK